MRQGSLVTMLLSLVFLAIGSIFGVGLNLNYGPAPAPSNHIVFRVLPTSKVSLVPTVGDTIDWLGPTGLPLQAQFPGIQDLSPCQGVTTTSHCVVVRPSSSGAVFPYTCDGCYDPAIGPVSRTGGPGLGGDDVSQRHVFPVWVHDVRRLLGVSSAPRAAEAVKQQPASTGIAAVVATGAIVQPAATCVNNKVALYMAGQPKPDLPVPVSAKDTIGFTGTITVTATEPLNGAATLCVNGIKPSTTQACTVNPTATGTYTYSLSSTQCGTATTEQFVVQ